jgi:hypothetical protein
MTWRNGGRLVSNFAVNGQKIEFVTKTKPYETKDKALSPEGLYLCTVIQWPGGSETGLKTFFIYI